MGRILSSAEDADALQKGDTRGLSQKIFAGKERNVNRHKDSNEIHELNVQRQIKQGGSRGVRVKEEEKK